MDPWHARRKNSILGLSWTLKSSFSVIGTGLTGYIAMWTPLLHSTKLHLSQGLAQSRCPQRRWGDDHECIQDRPLNSPGVTLSSLLYAGRWGVRFSNPVLWKGAPGAEMSSLPNTWSTDGEITALELRWRQRNCNWLRWPLYGSKRARWKVMGSGWDGCPR